MSTVVTLGPVGLKPTGAYNNTREYKKLDVVIYQGSCYIAKSDSIGQLPTNTTYWELLVQKGDTGNGITSIAKTGTSGLVDTYTITYTDETTSTFTVTNGEKGDPGEVTEEQLDEAMARANMVYNALPKVSDEGDSLTLDGTANCPMKMELKGNTEQTTYTGKNLCSSAELQSAVNVRFYIDKKIEKTLTISFTTNESLNNNSLYLSATNTLATTITANANTKATATFTLSDEQYSAIQNATNPYLLLYKSGANFTVPTDAQIENGSNPTSFEPYVGGTPSPNPDYPQDVRVVTGNNSVVVNDKQKIQLTNGTYSNASVTAVVNNGVITTSGTATGGASIIEIPLMNSIEIKTNTTYEIALNNETTMSSAGCYLFVNSDTNKKTTFQNQNAEIILNETNDLIITKLSIRIAQGNTASVTLTPVLNYDSYQSQTYPINLGTMELCKIGDYQDYIYKDNGNWYKHSEIGKAVLDGSESWNKTNNAFITNVNTTPNKGNRELNSYSNYFTHQYYQSGITSNIKNGEFGWNADLQLSMRNDNCSTANDFQTWLSTHNTTVYYVLATPTNTEITDTTLISQLNAIENAVSYDTQTNIVQENYSEPFIINAECVRSLKDIFELIQ